MPRAAGADNSVFFRERVPISDAERILRAMEKAHDNRNLLEMNGQRCAGRQISKLRWYDRPAVKSKKRKDVS
jgi:hypothetical protein